MRILSTLEVARKVRIGKTTLLRWLYSGKLAEPKRGKVGGQEVRLWTEKDLERVQKFKQANYRKGRGRKPKA